MDSEFSDSHLPSPDIDEAEPNATLTGNGDQIRDLLDELEESMDDVGAIKKRYMSKILPDDDEFNSSQVPIDTINKREVQDLIESIPKPMVQKPIQPGASPTDVDNRFLCWNATGIIRAQFGGENQNIDIMFHDTEKHSSVNFINEPNYTLGSMSEDVIVLGSNGKYGTGPSSIHGMNLLELSRDQQEWTVELPNVELIDGLAAGSGYIAVVTDHRNLRLFTNGGMQSYIFSLPGQVLCMSAMGRDLLLIYHNGAGQSDDQNLSMFVYHIDLCRNTVRQTYSNIPVALSKRSPLAWAGFSDEGTPCTYDYSGMLRMYRHDMGKSWMPILDLRELTSSALDHYFVVGVCEISQVVRAVKCRKSRFPDFETETAELLAFSLPMCEMNTDRGELEEEYMRLRFAELSYKKLSQISGIKSLAQDQSEANEKLMVNTVLRLFALYLKDNKEDLAKALVYMIPKNHMSKLAEFAWKTKRKQHFIDALNQAIEEREQMELDFRSKEDDVASVSSITSHHNFARDIEKELSKNPRNQAQDSTDDVCLKPVPLDKLTSNYVSNENNNKQPFFDDEFLDENDIRKTKKVKSSNSNIFSKTRPKA